MGILVHCDRIEKESNVANEGEGEKTTTEGYQAIISIARKIEGMEIRNEGSGVRD